ncbi:DUF2399 domain-containing protein [Streptomyces sp. NPDC046870]|uniref:DUF2399 domain-containing protein n=1 Tax=Streptomyces sp. NPDC046870 TaxID=3155135 RepID=UPI0034527E43
MSPPPGRACGVRAAARPAAGGDGAAHLPVALIAARADFDAAGLALVRAVLSAVPEAEAWRMTADDYTATLHPDTLDFDRLGTTPWDPALAAAMHACGRPAYEEGLLDQLLADLRQGYPSASTPACSHTTAGARRCRRWSDRSRT